MNKHRDLAKARLTEAEEELDVLLRAFGPNPNTSNERLSAARQRLIDRAGKLVVHCRDMVAEKGDKQYSKWQFYTPVIRGKAEVSGGFTYEPDADGNYWCKWSLREKLREFAGIPSYYSHWTEERSFKTRRAAMNRVSRELEKWEKKKSIRLPKAPAGVR